MAGDTYAEKPAPALGKLVLLAACMFVVIPFFIISAHLGVGKGADEEGDFSLLGNGGGGGDDYLQALSGSLLCTPPPPLSLTLSIFT
jgi:hypothetical protein